jgi:hypothetical protein
MLNVDPVTSKAGPVTSEGDSLLPLQNNSLFFSFTSA